MPSRSLRASPVALAACALGATAAVLALSLAAEGQSKARHGANIVFEVEPTKEIQHHVLFSHEVHLAQGAVCKDCHNGTVFLEERRLGINRFTMKDILRGKACGACHDGLTRSKSGAAVFAPTKNCTRCHNVKLRAAP